MKLPKLGLVNSLNTVLPDLCPRSIINISDVMQIIKKIIFRIGGNEMEEFGNCLSKKGNP
jgi:hypothetical protein